MDPNERNLYVIFGGMILFAVFVAVLDQLDKRRRRREREQRRSA